MRNAGAPWTQDDYDTLYRLYPRHGAKYVANRLGRSEKAVIMKARREGLLIGIIPGRVTIPELADAANVTTVTAERAAHRAGVTKTWGGRTTVPEKWATQYANETRARVEADALASTWYTLAQAATELGVHEHTIRHALRGHGSLAHALEGAIVRLGTQRQRYLHPTSIQIAKKRTSGAWLDYSQTARAWDCSEAALKRAIRGLGRLAPLVERVRHKQIPNRGRRGRIRVFHAQDVYAHTAEAHRILGHEQEAVA